MVNTYYEMFLSKFENDIDLAYDSDAADLASHVLAEPEILNDPEFRPNLEVIFTNLDLPIPNDQTMLLALTSYLDAQIKIQNEDNES